MVELAHISAELYHAAVRSERVAKLEGKGDKKEGTRITDLAADGVPLIRLGFGDHPLPGNDLCPKNMVIESG